MARRACGCRPIPESIRPDVGHAGNGGQRLSVGPDLKLTIVVTPGNHSAPEQWIPPIRLVREDVLPRLAWSQRGRIDEASRPRIHDRPEMAPDRRFAALWRRTRLFVFPATSMLFPIPPGGRAAPATVGLPEAEEHVLTTADGEKVIIWHVPPKLGRPVVLFFPGNGDFLAGRVSRFKGITADGAGLVALSYRGYAGSSGEPSEHGLLEDAAAAYTFTVARYDVGRIVAWDFSLGTGVAAAVAAQHQIGKLILESPYTSTADVAGALPRIVPVSLLMRDQFHSDQRILRVTVPLRRQRYRHSHSIRRTPVRAGPGAEEIRAVSRRRTRKPRQFRCDRGGASIHQRAVRG
jgi:hypothetical protein